MSKLYIAVHEDVPDHMVPVLVAHSVLGAHLAFDGLPDYDLWLKESFRKVVLKLNKKEFDRVLSTPDIYLGYENTVMDKNTSCIVLSPRNEYPKVIQFAKMWKPK